MQITTLHKTLATGLVLAALACLPTPARAQFTFSNFPTTVTIPQLGDQSITVSGTLSDTSGAVSGPFQTASLDVTFSDALNPYDPITDPTDHDNFLPFNLVDVPVPDPLGAGQVYTGPLFTFEVDPAALAGIYPTNFSLTYGGATSSQDFTIQLGQNAPVPETSTLPFVALGAGFVGFAAWRRRASLAKASA